MPSKDNFNRYLSAEVIPPYVPVNVVSQNATLGEIIQAYYAGSDLKQGDMVTTNPDYWGVTSGNETAYKVFDPLEVCWNKSSNGDLQAGAMVCNGSGGYRPRENVNGFMLPSSTVLVEDVCLPLFTTGNPYGMYTYACDMDFAMLANNNVVYAYRAGTEGLPNNYGNYLIYGIVSRNGNVVKQLNNSGLSSLAGTAVDPSGDKVAALFGGGFALIGRATSYYDNDQAKTVNGYTINFYDANGVLVGSNVCGNSAYSSGSSYGVNQIRALALPNGNLFVVYSDIISGKASLCYAIFTASGAKVVKNVVMYTSIAGNTGFINSISCIYDYNKSYIAIGGYIENTSYSYGAISMSGTKLYVINGVAPCTTPGNNSALFAQDLNGNILLAVASNTSIYRFTLNAAGTVKTSPVLSAVTSTATLANQITGTNYGTVLHSYDCTGFGNTTLIYTYRDLADGNYYVGFYNEDSAGNQLSRFDSTGASYTGLLTPYKTIQLPFPMKLVAMNLWRTEDASVYNSIVIETPTISGSYANGKFTMWFLPANSTSLHTFDSSLTILNIPYSNGTNFYLRHTYVPGQLKYKLVNDKLAINSHTLALDTITYYTCIIQDDITTCNMTTASTMLPPLYRLYTSMPRRVPRGIVLQDTPAGGIVYVKQSGRMKWNITSPVRYAINTTTCTTPGANFIVSGDTVTFISSAIAAANFNPTPYM